MRFAILHRFSWLLGAHVWREILQTVFLLALARSNSTAYGEVMLAFQFGAILLFLSEAGLNPYLADQLTHDPERKQAWLRRLAAVRLALLLLAGLGVWIFIRAQGYSPRLQWLVLGLGGAIGLESLAGTFFIGLQVAGKQAVESRIRGWAATLGWGYGLAALAAGWGVFRISLCKWIETLFSLVGAARAAGSDGRPVGSAGAWRPLGAVWRESLPFAWLAVAAILFNKANVLFLQRLAGSEAVAQYSATWQLVDAIPILVSNLLLGRVLYPLFTGQWRADRPALARLILQTVRWLSLTAGVVALTLALGSEPLIRLLYGPAYGEAARLQPVLAWTIPFALLHNTAAYLLLAAGRRRFLVLAYGAALALNLALCRFLMPAHPLSGAVWAMVLTKGCLTVTTVAAASRLLPFWRLATLGELLAVALAGGLAYWVAAPILGVGALLLAWMPAAGLAWRWWKEPARQSPPDSEPRASGSSG